MSSVGRLFVTVRVTGMSCCVMGSIMVVWLRVVMQFTLLVHGIIFVIYYGLLMFCYSLVSASGNVLYHVCKSTQ